MQVQEQTRLKDTEPLSKKKFHLHWEVVALFAITFSLVFLIAGILRTLNPAGGKNLADLPSMSVSFRPVKSAGALNLVATASASAPTRLYAFFSLKDNATLLFPDRQQLNSIQQQSISFVLTPDLVQAAKDKQGFLFVVVVKPNLSLLTADDIIVSPATATGKPLVGESVYRKLKEMTRDGDAATERVELPDPVTAFLPPPPKAQPVAAQATKRVVPTARTSVPATSTSSNASSGYVQLPAGRSAVIRHVVTQTRPPIDSDDDDLPVDSQGNYGQLQGQRVTGQQIQKQRL